MTLDFVIIPTKRIESISFQDILNKFLDLYGATSKDENGNWIYLNGSPQIYSSILNLNENSKITFSWISSDLFLSFNINEISQDFPSEYLSWHPKRNLDLEELSVIAKKWDEVGYFIALSVGAKILDEDIKAYYCFAIAICSFVNGILLADDGGWNNTNIIDYGYYNMDEIQDKIKHLA